ncbi:hypothetical protein Varpa_5292 [Variovorax paradoxus EPS]|uniref:Uncharacterized protein n=2 Tax=Variovorax paradoxus TaxID=34073 RepID=E6V6D9_VARPE|nr:hypothetical protein Varpa_5292 [Variovorax paradoxus EPS]
MRAALIGCVPILLAYGCAGVVYGNLPMMTPAGLIDMPGACAWLTAAMAFALAILAIDWLVRGELTPPQPQVIVVTKRWSRGSYTQSVMPPHVFPEPRSSLLRIGCLGVAAVACASALVGRATLALGWQAFARPGGLAPQAEWPLYPLQWVWPWLLPLARRPVVLGLIGAGAVLLAAAYFMNWRKVRGAWFPFLTVLPMLLTLNYLGDAGFDFAAARGLGGLVEPELARELAHQPGRYNVFNFLSLWGAIGFGTVGLILGFWLGRSRVMDED